MAYLYRPVDQHGQVINVLLSTSRDLAVRRFFTRALRARMHKHLPPSNGRSSRSRENSAHRGE